MVSIERTDERVLRLATLDEAGLRSLFEHITSKRRWSTDSISARPPARARSCSPAIRRALSAAMIGRAMGAGLFFGSLAAVALLLACATLGTRATGMRGEDVAGDGWISVSTPHVHLETDVIAVRASAIAWGLEDTAIALYEAFPPCELPSAPPPIEVMVFARADDFHRARPAGVAGHFGHGLSGIVSTPDRVVAAHGDARVILQTLAHEMTHQFVAYCYPTAPVWLNEGLASYYETILVEPDVTVVGRAPYRTRGERVGESVIVGGSIVTTVARGRVARPSELLGLSATEFYRLEAGAVDGDRNGNYAGAWALVHYGLLGRSPVAREGFGAFLAHVARGEHDPLAAFLHELAGGGLAGGGDLGYLDEEVSRYLHRADYLERRIRRIPPTIGEPEISYMDVDDVELHQAEVLLTQGAAGIEPAREHLARSRSLRALLLLALTSPEVDRDALLAEARDRAPDDLDVLLFDAGLALRAPTSEATTELLARLEARRDLRASELVALARLLLVRSEGPRALPHARRAAALAPGSTDAQLMLGLSLRAAGDDVPAVVPLRRALHLHATRRSQLPEALFAEISSWLAAATVTAPTSDPTAPPPPPGYR